MIETLPRVHKPTWRLHIDPKALEAEYANYRQAAGYVDKKVRLWGARAFLQRYPDLESWRLAPLEEQLELSRSLKYFANYLFLKHYLRPTLAYLFTARPKLALAAKRHLYTEMYAQFYTLGRQLGYADSIVSATLNFLFYVTAYSSKPATAIAAADLDAVDDAMRAYQPPEGRTFSLKTASSHLYRVRNLLFHAGILPEKVTRYIPNPARTREVFWADIPEPIRQVVWRYLDQLNTVRAVDTVRNNEGYLRRFFKWLAQTEPQVGHLGDITRPQIEAFKRWLQDTSCATGQPYSTSSIRSTLNALRCFLQTIQEWQWPEAPERLLVYASDLPILDRPLPRFLDDEQAVALLQAARQSEDLFTRVCVETLLRTGLRKGEFARLQLDSVVQIGDDFWLRVPLGKLHNDRYIPLHPDVKRLLDEWIVHRGRQIRSEYLFVRHGRRVSLHTIDDVVKRAAQAAGLTVTVSPHRLRHTLATQAVNRGMSLEAIAALLGHRSLTMTLVYARIADQTVRQQYLSVCDELDALYEDAVWGEKREMEVMETATSTTKMEAKEALYNERREQEKPIVG
jgi:site-specific recombinase XerD